MRFWKKIGRYVNRLADLVFDPPILRDKSYPSPPARMRVFLVRPGAFDPNRGELSDDRTLTNAAHETVQATAERIRDLLINQKVTVLGCLDRPRRYLQTMDIISEVLGAPTKFCHLAAPPHTHDLAYLEEFNGPVVIVCDGTNLARDLRLYPGPPVKLGTLGPPAGSGHELIIEYHMPARGIYQELNRWFEPRP